MCQAISFGYKMGWFAVRCYDVGAVVRTLGLHPYEEVSWENGIDAIYQDDQMDNVFVTPPLRGWILVAGRRMLGNGDEGSVHAIEKRLIELSKQFGEAQAFATERIVEYHHWVLVKQGVLTRAFAFLGEKGEILTNVGEITPAEEGFQWEGLPEFEWTPGEEEVMEVAGQWSIDPSDLGEVEDRDRMGVLGKMPNGLIER